MKRWWLVFLLLSTLSLTWLKITKIKAGGGPVEVRLRSLQGIVNQQAVKFDVYFHPTKPDEILAQTMYLYMQDPKDGRSCKLYSNRTDNTGKVSGECSSTVIGELKFYIHWMEGGRSSEDTTITFMAAPPVAKPTPSPIIKKPALTPSPSPIPSPSCQATPCPSSSCSPTVTVQPIATPAPSPQSTPSEKVTVMKAVQNSGTGKWLLMTVASFVAGFGLPIIFFIFNKK